MRKIIMEEHNNSISISEVKQGRPVFAKVKCELVGMVVKEEKGWILRLGGNRGATGWKDSRKELLESCFEHGYEFYVI